MSKKMCIYHGGCNDGFGAAYAVWKAFPGEDIEFHYGIYQEDTPDVAGKDVIMVDFSYKLDKLREIISLANSVTIIDHHKTAQADIQPLIESDEVSGHFDMDKSGAVLTWEYYHNTEVPLLLRYIQDRDLWRFELSMSKEVSEGLNLSVQKFELWDAFAHDVQSLADDGDVLLRIHRKRVDEAKKHFWMINIAGYDVPVVNAPYYMASDVAGELSEGHPFAAIYWDSEDHRTYSLRSREGGIDVSEIAKQFGGGGHARAAGFKINLVDLTKLAFNNE